MAGSREEKPTRLRWTCWPAVRAPSCSTTSDRPPPYSRGSTRYHLRRSRTSMSSLPSAESHAAADVLTQAARRRTFAVISHPDAGKSTLTEALALHARVIGQAGAVHGKAGRRG